MYNQEDLSTVLAHNLKDEALMQLVAVANSGAKVSVTLIIEVLIVYGDIISGAVYCDEMLNKLSEDAGDETPLKSLREYYRELKNNAYGGVTSLQVKPFYLHLENYSFLTASGNRIVSEGEIMRISIQKVSAFSLGRPE